MPLFETGKSFRDIALANNLQPYQYGAIIQDIIGESNEIKPALLDLSARRLFQELPLKGSIGQKNLAKTQLLYELRPIYREEIIADLEYFIEGVLGLSNRMQNNKDAAHFQVNAIKERSFYADNPSRLFFLVFLTGGFYHLLWTYRHWRHYKKLALNSEPTQVARQNDPHIIPFWCAFFADFYIVGAARRIREKSNEYAIKGQAFRPWLVFILFSVSSSSPNFLEATESVANNIFILLVLLLFDCLMAAQLAILQNRANRILESEGTSLNFRSLNSWDCIFIGFGFVFFILFAIFTLVPPSFLDA